MVEYLFHVRRKLIVLAKLVLEIVQVVLEALRQGFGEKILVQLNPVELI